MTYKLIYHFHNSKMKIYDGAVLTDISERQLQMRLADIIQEFGKDNLYQKMLQGWSVVKLVDINKNLVSFREVQ